MRELVGDAKKLTEIKDGGFGLLQVGSENGDIYQCCFEVLSHAKNGKSVSISGVAFGRRQWFPSDYPCVEITAEQYANKERAEISY